ncbi:portal protein [Vibrio mediterranei]
MQEVTTETRGENDVDLLTPIQNHGQELLGLLQTQLQEREPIEQRWVDDMRRYMGKYEEKFYVDAKEQDRSQVFIGYTRSKTDAWVAQMTDMLFPADDKNYGISPTPVPQLEKVLEDDPDQESDASLQAKQIMDEAIARARGMETQIDDQLEECDYAGASRWMLHYAGVLGTGIIRAPVMELKKSSKWTEVEPGTWAAEIIYEDKPSARNVYPWDFVPDMSATCIEDAGFTFEREYLNKRDLMKMLEDETKNIEGIKKLIKTEAKSTHAHTGDVLGYVNQIRQLHGLQPTYKDNRYEIWTYHGPVPYRVLVEARLMDENEELADSGEIEGVIQMAGDGTIIDVNLNPFDTEDNPYSVYCAEPDVTGIFGYGIPYLIKDTQDVMNSAWRAMLDNGVTTIGDQIVVNNSVLEPADGTYKFSPRKLWKTKGSATANAQFEAQKAFGVFSFQSRQAEYQSVIGMAKAFMDEESGLPMISQGEQGQVTPTLGGMSMLMNAANAVRRRQVKEFDDAVTKPLITRFYVWNMQFNSRNEIKGDMSCNARGTSALLVKEMQSAQIIELFDRFSAHPHLAAAFDWYNGLESLVKSMSLGVQSMLKPKSEYDKIIKQQQEKEAEQPQDPALLKAQMDMQLTQMKHEHQMQLEQFKADSNRQVEMMKMEGKAAEQEIRRQQAMFRYQSEQMKLAQQQEIETMRMAQQDKWNTEKLVSELRKLRAQQDHDMQKFLAEYDLKNTVDMTANYGLD